MECEASSRACERPRHGALHAAQPQVLGSCCVQEGAPHTSKNIKSVTTSTNIDMLKTDHMVQ